MEDIQDLIMELTSLLSDGIKEVSFMDDNDDKHVFDIQHIKRNYGDFEAIIYFKKNRA